MKKAKIRRRILSFLLAVCMMIPCFSVESYATENTEPSNEVATCTCAEKCVEDSINEYCDVCGVDYNGCTGEDAAVVYEGEEGTEDAGKEEADVYTVSATSFLVGSGDKVANIAMTPSNGAVVAGENVTVVAQNNLVGCTFVGWYLSSDINGVDLAEGKKAWSTNVEASYQVTGDVELVAVYEPVANANATVKVVGGNFTVSVNDEEAVEIVAPAIYDPSLPIGTKVTITATEAGFLNWYNEYDKIVSTGKRYTFTVTGDVILSMSKKATDGYVVVEFVSDYGQVVGRETCTKDTISNIKFPAGPSKMGWTFDKWDMTKQTIYSAIQRGETYIVVKPTYKENTESTCKVVVGTIVDGNVTELEPEYVTPGTKKKFVAPVVEGKTFMYWKDENDKTLGYSQSYSMIINKESTTVYAVYGDGSVEVDKKPVIVVTNNYTTNTDEKNKIVFSVTRDVPEEYTLVEHGIIASTQFGREATENSFVLGADKVTKYTSASRLLNGVYTLTANMTNKETVPVTVRGYLIVKNDDFKEEVYYSDITVKSYSDFVAHTCVYTYTKDNVTGKHVKRCNVEGCNKESVTEDHNLVYSVTGTTIAVSCEQNCGYVGNVTLEVQDKYCGLDNEVAWLVKTDDLTSNESVINYSPKASASGSGTRSTVVPGDFGTYVASVTVGDATVSDEFTIRHIDENEDGKCDSETCKATVAYNIIVKSCVLEGAEENLTLTNHTDLADEYVLDGDYVTVSTPNKLDYEFRGWYQVDTVDDINVGSLTGSAEEANYSFSYQPTANVVWVAVYAEVLKFVDVTFEGDGYTAIGTYKDETYEANAGVLTVPVGATVTVNVTNEDFISWLDQFGKVVTKDNTYTFTVVGNATYTMSKKVVNATLVEFVSDYNQIIASKSYTCVDGEITEIIEIPAGPSKKGYKFDAWSLTAEQIAMQIKDGATYIKVTPNYIWDPAQFVVTVYINGVKDTDQSDDEYLEGSVKVVNAPAILNEGEGDAERIFSHWTDGEGVILGYSTTYSMKITKSVELKAVYVKPTVTVVQKPTMVMTDVYAMEEGEEGSKTHKLAFSATRDVPNGYTLVEHGILVSTKYAGTNEGFVLGDSDITKFVSTGTLNSGVFTLTLNLTGFEGKEVKARGYLIVSKDGQEEIYYSDLETCTYNSVAGGTQ